MSAPTVGYVVRMFPQTSETFIANELLALEGLGVPLRVYSYRQPRAVVPHRYLNAIEAPVTYLPDPLNRHADELIGAARAARRRDGARFSKTARYVLRHTLRERNLDTWRRFLQSTYLAGLLALTDVAHLHAHFAHGATRVAMLTGMLTGLPYSFTAHARDLFNDSVDLRLLRDKVEQARFVVTVSNYNREYLAERIGARANGHVRVLYNGVDLQRFSPDPNITREDNLVLGVGRFVEKKGVSVLIDALHILREDRRDVRCQLVGEGDLRSELERDVRERGLSDVVSFDGTRPQEELPDYYRRATLLAMPAVLASDGDRDALPTVLLEALACGVPIVASRLSGIPEIIDHEENGLLVPPGDAAALAAAIERLLTDRALRERLGRAARTKAERAFDVEHNTRELYRLFVEHAAAELVASR